MLAALFLSLLIPARDAGAAAFPGVQRSTDPVIVVYPAEDAVLPTTDAEFLLGSVSDPTAAFTINGQTVTVHPAGGFLAWVPVEPGTFTFRCDLALKGGTTAHYERRVFITPPVTAMPAKPLAIDRDSLSPKADLELRPGDWLVVRMRATPGQPARFRLAKRPWQPMVESNPALGLYEGSYLVVPGEELEPAPIEVSIGSGWSEARARTSARVSLNQRGPSVAVVRGNGLVTLKTGPGEGELFPVYGGARLLVAGRQGPESRVLLAGGQTAWIETRHLEPLPPGAHPPRAVTDVVSTKPTEEGTIVRVGITERVPFQIEEAGDLGSVTIRLHYAVAHTNWMVYNSQDPLIHEVRLKQDGTDSVLVTVRFKPGRTLWGYRASYEGSSVRLELRKAPRFAPPPASPLAGRTIFLDPGHMPSAPGTVGALGTREMDVNFAIAKAVEGLLLKENAVPVLSRTSPEDEVGLPERPRMAWDRKAEFFVSIHNNNLSGGKNPFSSPHGFSVFYYHPHSLPLARDVYRSYEAHVPLPGEELRYGDLLVARMTEMPAVLTESAYLTFPDQEQMLLDGKFRRKVAEAIVGGLRSYAESERAREARTAPAAAPAAAPAKAEKPLPQKPRVERARPKAPAPRPSRKPARGRRTARVRRTPPA